MKHTMKGIISRLNLFKKNEKKDDFSVLKNDKPIPEIRKKVGIPICTKYLRILSIFYFIRSLLFSK